MDTVLCIVCIIALCVLVYYLTMGYSRTKQYRYDCKTIYIPETMDIDLAFQSVNGLKINELKKRAIQLGATEDFINNSDKIKLKLYIIQNSISEDHILTTQDKARLETQEKKDNVSIVLNNDELTAQGIPDVNGDRVPNYVNLVANFDTTGNLSNQIDLRDARITLSELSEDLE